MVKLVRPKQQGVQPVAHLLLRSGGMASPKKVTSGFRMPLHRGQGGTMKPCPASCSSTSPSGRLTGISTSPSSRLLNSLACVLAAQSLFSDAAQACRYRGSGPAHHPQDTCAVSRVFMSPSMMELRYKQVGEKETSSQSIPGHHLARLRPH